MTEKATYIPTLLPEGMKIFIMLPIEAPANESERLLIASAHVEDLETMVAQITSTVSAY